ncbi:LysR family transcriptional regulator [Nocardiopsis ansamitocini]|uniref:LysR family transcriptional regulator n=1 Tax=Nocardiopsis ansamitocini TaxID=1670832 RepID=A0A9W6UKT5_9ACTN|nr:LysR family transcriptional regulator [Nocardiopsis ansamitocini]GLU50329.1 LysR family transcriptional regulator [Nocardiopsis ansamitocini]
MIDPRRLAVLRALADHRTVTAAASALHLTPSAVSQQLAAMEAEVGQPLLERRGRTVRLTRAGEILAVHAGAVAAQLERAEAELAAHTQGTSGEVTVAAFATAIGLVVAPAIASLATAEPQVDVRVRDAEGNVSLPMLVEGEVDIAITPEYRGALRDDERITRVSLFVEPFDAVLPGDHRLAGDRDIAITALAADRWVTPWPGNPCHDVVQLACEHAGFELRPGCLSDDFRAVTALVAAGAGVALVPRSALHGVTLAGAVRRPLNGSPPTRRVFAALRRGSEHHPLHAAVLDALRAAAPDAGGPAEAQATGSPAGCAEAPS